MRSTRRSIKALALGALLSLAPVVQAGMFICVDPVTGAKTFTDRACPSAGRGEKIQVEATNFGNTGASSNENKHSRETWVSDREKKGTSTRELAASGERHIQAAHSVEEEASNP